MERETALDKRKAQRLDIPMYVEFNREKHAVSNISGTGMMVVLEHPLNKGARLNTHLYFFTDPRPVSMLDEVVWCRREIGKKEVYFNVGLRHIKIAPRDKTRFLFDFCETLINYSLFHKTTKAG